MKDYSIQDRILGRILEEKSEINRGKPFLRFKDVELTYGEFNEMVNRVANSLLKMGIRKGDKVCLFLPNCPEFLYTAFALAKIGAVEVPINVAYKGEILHYVIENSDSIAIVVDEQYLEHVEAIQHRLKKIGRIIIRSQDPSIGKGFAKDTMAFRNLLDHKPERVDMALKHSDLLAIMYTSGTTGPSKGVMIPHCQAVTFALDWIKATGYASDDILYTTLPLFHAVAYTLGVMPTLICDSRMVIMEKFSASRFWDDIRKYDATIAHAIFSMLTILLNQPEKAEDRDHRLRAIYMGGSSLSPAFEKRFDTKVLEVYGATENGCVTMSPYGQEKPGTCGKENTEHFEVKIVDGEDNEVAAGTPGEVILRPKKPYVMMMGYYKMPEATVEAFRNLWFHTGDRLYKDQDGYFHFVDRLKDTIRRRGENISSFEVERVVNLHPNVLESAAVPVPSELGEDEVKVCVVVEQGKSLLPEELLAYCEDRMPYFMIPRYIEFKENLPKTETSKIEKYKLKTEGVTENTWDRESSGYKIKKR